MNALKLAALLAAATLAACSDTGSTVDLDASRGGGGDAGLSGTGLDAAGGWHGDAGYVLLDGGSALQLTGTIRDFRAQNPIDFENPIFTSTGTNMDDRGIVAEALAADGKPAYAGPAGGTLTTSGPDNFFMWFHDVQANQKTDYPIRLARGAGGVYTFDDQDFFPIDGQLFGNEGRNHNFHFTYELHTRFTYSGGERFTFTGDDDLWVFINGRRVIDLGGIHGQESQTADLDQLASSIGLQLGGTYPLDLFFAERHVTASHFRIDTTLVLESVLQ